MRGKFATSRLLVEQAQVAPRMEELRRQILVNPARRNDVVSVSRVQ